MARALRCTQAIKEALICNTSMDWRINIVYLYYLYSVYIYIYVYMLSHGLWLTISQLNWLSHGFDWPSHTFNICLFNSHSIVNKLSNFQGMVYSSSLSAVVVTETWLSEFIYNSMFIYNKEIRIVIYNKKILPSGYSIFVEVVVFFVLFMEVVSLLLLLVISPPVSSLLQLNLNFYQLNYFCSPTLTFVLFMSLLASSCENYWLFLLAYFCNLLSSDILISVGKCFLLPLRFLSSLWLNFW